MQGHYIGYAERYRLSLDHDLHLYHVIVEGDRYRTFYTDGNAAEIEDFRRERPLSDSARLAIEADLKDRWLVPIGQVPRRLFEPGRVHFTVGSAPLIFKGDMRSSPTVITEGDSFISADAEF